MNSIPKQLLTTEGMLRSLNDRSTVRELREALVEARRRGCEAAVCERIKALLRGLPTPPATDLPALRDVGAPQI